MEWVVGIQVDAEARIFYVHMDNLKHCAAPDPEPSWPEVARGTSIVVSTCAPSTFAPTEIVQSQPAASSAHQTGSVETIENDVRASSTNDHSEEIQLDTNTAPTVQITFIFIDFRVCDFAFAFKMQNAPCVSRFKRVLFSDRFQFAF